MGKGEKVEQAVVEESQAGTEIQEEAQAKTYTQEELDAAKAEIKTDADKQYQGIQRVVSQKDQKIKELEAKPTQPSIGGDDTVLEFLLQDRKSKAAELGETDPMIAKLEAELAERKQKQSQGAQLRWQEQVTQQQGEKFDQQIKEAGLDPSDERLDDFHDAFEDAKEDGKFGKAERKLDRILGKIKPSESKGKETEEDTFAKRLEEEKRKWMEEHGLLATETGGPSAGGQRSFTAEEIRTMSYKDFKANKEAINAAYIEGRVT